MKLQQFTLRDLLLATALIAVGFAVWPMVDRYYGFGCTWDEVYRLLLPGWASIGAGISTPFHAKRLGALMGIVAGAVYLHFDPLGIYPLSDWMY